MISRRISAQRQSSWCRSSLSMIILEESLRDSYRSVSHVYAWRDTGLAKNTLPDRHKSVESGESTNMFARRLIRLFPLPRPSLYSSALISRSSMASRKYSSPATQLLVREFPSSGFEVIDPSQKVEEERLPFYSHDDYYPMRIGEVIKDRYQVVAKLGYGTSSTVWLCHDLRYVCLASF